MTPSANPPYGPNAATYRDAGRLTSALNRYINALAEYPGTELADIKITVDSITSRTLSLSVKDSISSLPNSRWCNAAQLFFEKRHSLMFRRWQN
jgi:hypothetical protein